MCDKNCGSCGGCHEPLMAMAQDSFVYDYDTYSTPGVVLLGVTNRCNLQCPYCFVHQSNADMTLEIAEAAVEMMMKNAEKNGVDPQVIFFGGEPLIMFDEIIVPIVEKYEDRIRKWGVTTNGILLDEDKVDFFYKHGIEPLISFDGIKPVQDAQRPGKGFSSYERFVDNLPYVLVRFPNVTVRMTITKDSLPYLYQSFIMMDEFGVQNITAAPNQFEEWTDAEGEIWKDQFRKIALLTYNRIRKGEFVPKFHPLKNMVQGVWKVENFGPLFANSLLRCGMGTTTFSVTPNGRIVPCQERISDPTFVIGNVFDGIDEDKHKEFLEWYWKNVNTIKCQKPCQPYVRGMCFGDTCPASLEDTNFKVQSTSCTMKQWGFDVAYRIYYLTYGSIDPFIRDFFYGGLENESC